MTNIELFYAIYSKPEQIKQNSQNTCAEIILSDSKQRQLLVVHLENSELRFMRFRHYATGYAVIKSSEPFNTFSGKEPKM